MPIPRFSRPPLLLLNTIHPRPSAPRNRISLNRGLITASSTPTTSLQIVSTGLQQRRTMSTPADHKPLQSTPKEPPVPRPSSSVLLISPTNQILLLHRVRTSSSFASAHVFPGGALSHTHDGTIPAPDSPLRHADGPAYRLAAIRETFEESGILLARSAQTGKHFSFSSLGDGERERGRKAVHAGTQTFGALLESWGAVADTEALIPFTRWVTPPNVPKRFTTMMYIYFLPLGSVSPTKSAAKAKAKQSASTTSEAEAAQEDEDEIVIPHPTHDGGIEHTAARFLPPNKWIALARQNRIILFPPQFFLTLLLAEFLAPTVTSPGSPIPDVHELQLERDRVMEFLNRERTYNGEPEVSWADACISPLVLGKGEYGDGKQDGVGKGVDKHTAVLDLASPGREVEQQGLGRRGIKEWVVVTKFKPEGPRDVDVKKRDDVLARGVAKL